MAPATHPEPTGEPVPARIDAIRSWRERTEGLGLPHYPSDPPMTCNNKGWWRDVDALLREVDWLTAALRDIGKVRAGDAPADMDRALREVQRILNAHGVGVEQTGGPTGGSDG